MHSSLSRALDLGFALKERGLRLDPSLQPSTISRWGRGSLAVKHLLSLSGGMFISIVWGGRHLGCTWLYVKPDDDCFILLAKFFGVDPVPTIDSLGPVIHQNSSTLRFETRCSTLSTNTYQVSALIYFVQLLCIFRKTSSISPPSLDRLLAGSLPRVARGRKHWGTC